MIFDANYVPQSDNEYQQRLLATTILLVKAAGGTLTVTTDLMSDMGGAGSMLHQSKDENGNLILEVQTIPSEIKLPSRD